MACPEPWPLRHHWLHWMGALDTPLASAYDEVWPCQEVCSASGMRDLRNPDLNTACSRFHICVNCQKVIAAVGDSWDLRTTTEAILGVLHRLAKAHLDSDPDIEFHDFSTGIHRCRPDCVGLPDNTL